MYNLDYDGLIVSPDIPSFLYSTLSIASLRTRSPFGYQVVIQAPRKFDITRILRYKVQMKATNPLLTLGSEDGGGWGW